MLRLFPESFFSYPSHRSFNSFSLLFYIFHAPPSLTSGGRPPFSVPGSAGFWKGYPPLPMPDATGFWKSFPSFYAPGSAGFGKNFPTPLSYHKPSAESLPAGSLSFMLPFLLTRFLSFFCRLLPAHPSFASFLPGLSLRFFRLPPLYLLIAALSRLSYRSFHIAALSHLSYCGFHIAAFFSRSAFLTRRSTVMPKILPSLRILISPSYF